MEFERSRELEAERNDNKEREWWMKNVLRRKRWCYTERESPVMYHYKPNTNERERERGWVALIERLIELCQMLSDILIWAAAGWHAAAHLCVCVSCRPDEIIPCSKNDLLTQSNVSGDYFLNPPSVLKTCLCEWSAYSTATHTVCMTL